jgi:hypothetical protein
VEILGNNKTAQNRFGQPSYIVLVLYWLHLYHFTSGKRDQSAVARLTDRTETVQNWLGKFGAFLADMIVYKVLDLLLSYFDCFS